MATKTEKTPVQTENQPTTAPGPEIADSSEVGGTPGGAGNGPLSQPVPSQQVTARAASGREYVAGSPLQWFANMPRALPWALDDVAADFGADIYDRMLLDAQVRSTVNVFKAAVIETGAEMLPAIDDKDDPDFQAAKDLADDAGRMLDQLTMSLDDILWDMLTAMCQGHKMSEQVYALDTTYTGKKAYELKQLAVKPRESVAFVVDVYLNVLGILGRIPGQPFGVQAGMLLAELQQVSNFLPRSKFAVLTFRPQNNDPRGTSILRPAFAPWNFKQQIVREYLKYLAQFASPSLIGFTAENAEPYVSLDAAGNPVIDTASGQIVMRSPEMDMVAALQAFANGSATAFPFGAEVKELAMSGAGEAFINGLNLQDRQIAKSILGQTLATEESEHQTRAASSTHKDIFDLIVRQAKRSAERMLEHDVLTVWMKLNGWQDRLHLRPRVSLGSSAEEDKAAKWIAAANLQRAGYLHPSQYTDLDEELGLPEREPAGAVWVPVTEMIRDQEQGLATGSTAEDEAEDADEELNDPDPASKSGQNGTKKAPDSPKTTSGNGQKPAPKGADDAEDGAPAPKNGGKAGKNRKKSTSDGRS